jgi:hypothetical protein
VAADQSPLRAELDHVGASFRKAGAVPLAALPGDAGVQAVWRALGAL